MQNALRQLKTPKEKVKAVIRFIFYILMACTLSFLLYCMTLIALERLGKYSFSAKVKTRVASGVIQDKHISTTPCEINNYKICSNHYLTINGKNHSVTKATVDNAIIGNHIELTVEENQITGLKSILMIIGFLSWLATIVGLLIGIGKMFNWAFTKDKPQDSNSNYDTD